MSRKILIDDDAAQHEAILTRLRRLEQSVGVPTGMVALWKSGVTIPSGWLQCNGGTFSAVTYQQLAALWGTTTLPADPGLAGYVAIVRAR